MGTTEIQCYKNDHCIGRECTGVPSYAECPLVNTRRRGSSWSHREDHWRMSWRGIWDGVISQLFSTPTEPTAWDPPRFGLVYLLSLTSSRFRSPHKADWGRLPLSLIKWCTFSFCFLPARELLLFSKLYSSGKAGINNNQQARSWGGWGFHGSHSHPLLLLSWGAWFEWADLPEQSLDATVGPPQGFDAKPLQATFCCCSQHINTYVCTNRSQRVNTYPSQDLWVLPGKQSAQPGKRHQMASLLPSSKAC